MDRTGTRKAKPPVQRLVTNDAGVTTALEDGDPGVGTSGKPGRGGRPGDIQPQMNPIGMISVADYDEEERSTLVTLRLRDKTKMALRVTYDPNSVTEERSAYMRELAEDGEDQVLAEALCSDVLIDWEMYGPLTAVETVYDEDGKIERDEHGRPVRQRIVLVGDGEKVPLDPEIVRHLKTSWLVQLWKEISRDAMGGDEKDGPKGHRRSQRR